MPVSTKTPQAVFDTVFAFPPNRETLGGTAYLILETAGTSGTMKSASESRSDPDRANILVDCPAFNDTNQDFIAEKGGISTLFITHRGGMADAPKFQKAFNAQVIIQEQEAYLLPTVEIETFERDRILSPTSRVFWNSGHSPGSACLYHQPYGGILFTGRHLLPNRNGDPRPLRQSKTFHWPRQLRNANQLLIDFTPENLSYICPGASTGFLRGEKKIESAYERLKTADWEKLATAAAKL
ncbi:MAG: MBL fold metallo-hydrolase [Leptolyngbya foveolarum]|uniref:MBL fold metallo-hydrolase n=1 Tax=Leptolyngbya foveolarum TaxID=47253 RepID=A0A2W4UQL7_9CYAN|nr:MAG: MBL fold metallo-hydrolase [Leptolyngbya foveolarum]